MGHVWLAATPLLELWYLALLHLLVKSRWKKKVRWPHCSCLVASDGSAPLRPRLLLPFPVEKKASVGCLPLLGPSWLR